MGQKHSISDKGSVNIGGSVILSGIFTTAAITATVDNYSITDLANVSIVKFVPSGNPAGNRVVRGIDATGIPDGFILHFINASTDNTNLRFNDLNANSTAANQFSSNGNKSFNPREGGTLMYDATVSKWTLIANSNV